MALQLPPKMLSLLREVVQNRLSEMLSVLDSIDDTQLTEQQRFDLCQAVTDEFCLTGLKPDSEPNQRGLLLEDLIDHLLQIPIRNPSTEGRQPE